MKLRPQLFLLVAAAIVPVLVVALVAFGLLIGHERETMRREALGRTRSVMSAVDAELSGSIATLQALAASKSLAEGNLRAFHEEARRVLATQPEWLNIGLATPAREQLVDAVFPFGRRARFGADDEAFAQAVRERRPAIGGVLAGAAVQVPSVRVRVPVLYGDGEVRYVISAPLRPESFGELLRAQRLPEDWVIALVDRDKRFIARIPRAAPGNPVSESFRAAIDQAPEGWFRGRTIEGTETYTPYVTSELSGWVLGIAVPATVVEAGARRTAAIMAAGVAAAVAIALLLAWLLARSIAGPIASLAAATQGRGPVELPRRPIDEVARLAEALRERQTLVEREKAALQRESDALRAADRAKDEFLAMLSHELRNPLSALTSAGQVLKMGNADGEALAHARGVVERQTRHMARLVEDLLDMSRVTMGKAILVREVFDLAAAVDEWLRVWRAAGRFAQHPLSLESAAAWVNTDRARAEQILNNLIDNALKFTPKGRAIHVLVQPSDESVLLEVSDDGDGLAPELLPHVFEPFVQGEQNLDRSRGGLGIGLALVKSLAEMQGGAAWAASPGPGRGTTFSVRFPAAAPEAHKPASPLAAVRLGPRKILVVEDNDDARAMLRVSLSLDGHDVHEARDAASGLALAARERPEIALIDVGLPDVDGYELARRLRSQLDTSVRLIALTGYGQPDDRRRALEAGFDAHLVKPVAPDELAQAMASVSA